MGYEIPVSISDATAVNPTTTFTAGTVINFGQGADVRGDVMTTENTADLSPTATSAASTGGDAASQTAVGDKGKQASYVMPAIILGAVIVGLVVYKKFF